MKKIVLAIAAFAIALPVLAQQADMPAMDHSKMPMMEHPDPMAMMHDPANPYGAAEMDMHKKMMMASGRRPLTNAPAIKKTADSGMPINMNGRRRPKRVQIRSDRAPTVG